MEYVLGAIIVGMIVERYFYARHTVNLLASRTYSEFASQERKKVKVEKPDPYAQYAQGFGDS